MNRLLFYLLLLLIVLVGLQSGISYSHLMQWPGKLRLTATEYIRVQNVLIQYKLGVGALEVPTLLLFPIVVFIAHRNRTGFVPGLLAGMLFLTLFCVWALFIEPINHSVSQWSPQHLPADWTAYRQYWHELHAVRLVLFAGTLLALVGTMNAAIIITLQSTKVSPFSINT